MRLLAALLVLAAPAPLVAQEFVPPDDSGEQARGESGQRSAFGVFSFMSRVGYDFTDRNEGVLSAGVDAGRLLSDRVRLRGSGEVGFGSDRNSYVVGVDAVFRLTPETETAIPYVGMGAAIAGIQDCDIDPDCPALWGQFSLGFEIRYTSHMNLMIEYRGEDLLRQHRILAGFAARLGD